MDLRNKILNEKTLSGMFLTSASHRYGNTIYFSKDEKGKYTKKMPYSELLNNVFSFSSSVINSGIVPGDAVAIMSNPRPEFAITDIGTTLIGAITGGIYVTDSPGLLEFKLNHLNAKVLVIENIKIKDKYQLEKVLSIDKSNLTDLKKIVVIGEFDSSEDDRLISFDEFISDVKSIEKVSALLKKVEPENPAVVIYSSGTEGFPKGALLTHLNLTSNIRQVDQLLYFEEGMKYVDFLPPAHVFGYMVRRSLEALGAKIYFSHRDTLQADLASVSPNLIAGVPKFFMTLQNAISKRLQDMNIDIDSLDDMRRKMILSAAGLAEVKYAINGAAAIPDDTVSFFLNKLGFRIDQGYGVSETSPSLTVNTEKEWKLGTVGRAIPGVKMAILDDNLKQLSVNTEGEIAASGENVFIGYWKDKEKTEKVLKNINGEKWYLSGDLGIMDEDGFIRITDRKDDMLVPISGENVSSSSVENKIVLNSRYAGFAVPYGTKKEYIVAIVWSDETKYPVILEDAKKSGIQSANVLDILMDKKFKELLKQDLEQVCKKGDFNSHERPRGFIFLVNPGEDEVTATAKARKKGVRAKFSKELEELYTSKEFLKVLKQ